MSPRFRLLGMGLYDGIGFSGFTVILLFQYSGRKLAEHWISLRTTNPIESGFATVKLRTKATRGAGNRSMASSMAFKLLLECEKKWRKIRGWREIKKMLSGVEYKDGVMITNEKSTQEAAVM